MTFWRGKKVLLTGHTGFKGAWMSRILCTLGADVTGFALPPATTPALFSLLNLEKSLRHIAGDIRDAGAVSQAMRTANPDILIHIAAQPLVLKSYQTPVETFATNVMGTVNVLEAARGAQNMKAAVVVTTDKCYANDDSGRLFTEDDKLGGFDPYSASKAGTEIVAASYDRSFFRAAGVGLATARAGNVIGGGDWAENRLIPDVVRAQAAGTAVKIRNPLATRPWQHVLEPVFAYLLLAEKLYADPIRYASGWNFGPEETGVQSVKTVLSLLQKTFPFTLELDENPQPHEAKALGLDITKAKEQLGWQPRLTLADAVDWTGLWYQSAVMGDDVAALTDRQIAAYAGSASVQIPATTAREDAA